MNNILTECGWFRINALYKKSWERKELITLEWVDQQLVGTFAQSLNFKEYEFIHQSLVIIIEQLDATFDDSKCSLGYLQDGSEARIITNWIHWEKFLTAAKLKSLEGKKVAIFGENEELLLEGLLVDYETDPLKEIFTIISASVITLFGERNTTGANLKIEAVYE